MATAVADIKEGEQLGVEQILPVDRIRPRKDQPREHFNKEEIKRLAVSIDTVGMVMAIEVRPVDNDPDADWEIVDGERRYRANKILENKEVRCLVKPPSTDDDAWVRSMIANICRRGYIPKEIIHQSLRFQAMGWSNDTIAAAYGYSTSWLYQYLKLRDLPEEILDLMDPQRPERTRLKLTVAATIAQIRDDEPLQIELANMVCECGLSVAQALHIIKGRAYESGQRVGTMAQSPRSDWRRFVNLCQKVGPNVNRFMDLPGTRFDDMFEERTADEVSTLHANLIEAAEGLRALSRAVGHIADKKMKELD